MRGTSLAVQWLGHSTFTARAWVQFLVQELRSCKLLSREQDACSPCSPCALLGSSVFIHVILF